MGLGDMGLGHMWLGDMGLGGLRLARLGLGLWWQIAEQVALLPQPFLKR